jgi:hypothetical protein
MSAVRTPSQQAQAKRDVDETGDVRIRIVLLLLTGLAPAVRLSAATQMRTAVAPKYDEDDDNGHATAQDSRNQQQQHE